LRPGGSIAWQVGPQITQHGQAMPLDLLLHPVFTNRGDACCDRRLDLVGAPRRVS
jgi:hypothetical protein